MERILAGVDGSPDSLHMLGWVGDLAERARAELVVARVLEPEYADAASQDPARHDRGLRDLDAWCGSFPFRTLRWRTMVVDGEPAHQLLAVAHDQEADLLVVGGRGRGGFPHLHLGSVAHHLTHHTTMPLAIVPPTTAPLRRIVLGVDGSPGSRHAVEFCAQLAARVGVGVSAVYSYGEVATLQPESEPRSLRARAEAEVRSWVAPLEEAGIPVDLVLEKDLHPVAALTGALDADPTTRPHAVVVLGARGLGGFPGLRLGRVPLQVVHNTGSAVIIVPLPPEG